MSICPLCNGFEKLHLTCSCGNEMVDCGRIMDYYDDYSAYMEIDQLKLEDGYPNDHKKHKCPHLFSCPSCMRDDVILMNE